MINLKGKVSIDGNGNDEKMKKDYEKIISKLLAKFQENRIELISVRTLFGGSSVCYDGVMFGWIYNGQFYLRGHLEHVSMFIELKMESLALDIGATTKRLKYYKVNDTLWKDEEKLVGIIQRVIEYACQDKMAQRQIKKSRVKDMPNMTLSLERALFKVGIFDVESFRKSGAYESYFKLEQHNREISANILFILYSALEKVHVGTLSEKKKQKLKREYSAFVIAKLKKKK